MLFEKDDLGYLFKKYRKNKYSLRLQRLSDKLFNQYIKEIGLPDEYLSYIKELKRNQKHKIKYINGDAVAGTFADISDIKLNQIFAKKQKENIEQVGAYLSKYQGYRLDTKKTSVLEFYAILENIKKDASKN